MPSSPSFRLSGFPSWRVVLAVGACAGVCATPARPQDGPEAQRLARVHSAFVLNFARYTTWPERALEPAVGSFSIEVLGNPELARQLRSMTRGERIHDRSIEVREAECPDARADLEFRERLRRSQVVVLGRGSESCTAAVLEALAAAPVLTVGEPSGFVEAGGMLELLRREDRVRFTANLDALRAHEIQLSSRVLDLAESIRGRR